MKVTFTAVAAVCCSGMVLAAWGSATKPAGPATNLSAEAPPTTRRVLGANALSLQLSDCDAAAAALAKSLLAAPLVKERFIPDKQGAKPMVRIGRFRNDTTEKLNLEDLLGMPLGEALLQDGRASVQMAGDDGPFARPPAFLLTAAVSTLRTDRDDGVRETTILFQARLLNDAGEAIWIGRHTLVKTAKK